MILEFLRKLAEDARNSRVSSAIAEEKPGIEVTTEGDSCVLTAKSKTIRTLEDALTESNTDLSVWEVERHVINKWDCVAKIVNSREEELQAAELWQVKVWLRRIKPEIRAFDAVLENLKNHAPKYPKITKKVTGQHCLEIALYDAHFGKLAWGAETGTDYDLEIQSTVYQNAVEDLLALTSGFKIERILFPIGQDFFHINNPQNTTARGTPQDVDGRLQKVFEVAYRAVIKAIDYCAAVAPIEIIYVPGNHDPDTSFYLCFALGALYSHCEQVTVDHSPKWRKYRQYGTCLLGLTHGNEEAHNSLPTIMADEVPEMWAATEHREIHLGHFHKKKEVRFLAGDSYGSVRVRVIPSLTGTDAWHYRKGFVKGLRAAEAYLWHKELGYRGYFSTGIRL